MPRAVWTGVIGFGMVSIPIKLFKATENKDIKFNQVKRDTKKRIRMLRWDPEKECKVSPDEIVKGYQYKKDHYVTLEKEDIERIPIPTKHTISISSFVERDEIDPIYYERSYYVTPEESGLKPYLLLIHIMQNNGLVAIAKVTIKTKEHLCSLRANGNQIILETLYYPDEIRKPKEISSVEVSSQEIDMASTLVNMLRTNFNPVEYKDSYREAIMEIVDAKLNGKETMQPQEVEKMPVVDLIDALKASMESSAIRN